MHPHSAPITQYKPKPAGSLICIVILSSSPLPRDRRQISLTKLGNHRFLQPHSHFPSIAMFFALFTFSNSSTMPSVLLPPSTSWRRSAQTTRCADMSTGARRLGTDRSRCTNSRFQSTTNTGRRWRWMLRGISKGHWGSWAKKARAERAG
jgi:hypothetical protein